MDGTEDDLQFGDDETEVESQDSDKDLYDNTINDDLLDELFASDDDSDNFEGF